jgi:hypothetical protein
MFMKSTIAAIAAFVTAQSFGPAMPRDESAVGTERRIERALTRSDGTSHAGEPPSRPHHYYDRYHRLRQG